MSKTTVKAASFPEFHDIVSKQTQDRWWGWFFRGHTRKEYKLVPKVGRPPYSSKVADERSMFIQWKRHAVALMGATPTPLTDWDLLAIAQHHGLATRLLDWSFSALNATFFALVEADGTINDKEDSVVYGHFSNQKGKSPQDGGDPFSNDNSIVRLMPSPYTPRIARQGGIFTVHTPPTASLEDSLPKGDELLRIEIAASGKKEFATQLSHYGINRMAFFPDLDGLSAHINWSFLSLDYVGDTGA